MRKRQRAVRLPDKRVHAARVCGVRLLLLVERHHGGVEVVAAGDEPVHEPGDHQHVGRKPRHQVVRHNGHGIAARERGHRQALSGALRHGGGVVGLSVCKAEGRHRSRSRSIGRAGHRARQRVEQRAAGKPLRLGDQLKPRAPRIRDALHAHGVRRVPAVRGGQRLHKRQALLAQAGERGAVQQVVAEAAPAAPRRGVVRVRHQVERGQHARGNAALQVARIAPDGWRLGSVLARSPRALSVADTLRAHTSLGTATATRAAGVPASTRLGCVGGRALEFGGGVAAGQHVERTLLGLVEGGKDAPFEHRVGQHVGGRARCRPAAPARAQLHQLGVWVALGELVKAGRVRVGVEGFHARGRVARHGHGLLGRQLGQKLRGAA